MDPAPWRDLYRDAGRARSYEEKRERSLVARLSWARERSILARLVAATHPAGRWLDLACGPGRFLELLPRGAVGVDLSPAMLALARDRARAAGATLLAADAGRLPFPAGAFEGAICIRFLHHLATDERTRALQELRRVARRWVVASYPSSATVRAWTRRLRGKPMGPRRSRADFAREVEASGFVVRATHGVFVPFSETTLALLERRD